MNINQNLGNIMQQAQKMQERMQKMQEELGKQKVSGKAGGVEVEMLGNHQVVNVKIEDKLMDIDEKEILEGLLITAFNAASDNLNAKTKEYIGQLTAGLNIPTDLLKDEDEG